MSPHILIDKALESLEFFNDRDPCGKDALELITTLYMNNVITREEFNHYNERHLKAIRQHLARRVA